MKTDYISINKEAYNKLAKQYFERHKNIDSKNEMSNENWSLLFKRYRKNINSSALEIGPGDGRILKILELCNFQTTAVEFSTEMMKYATLNSPTTLFLSKNVLDVNFEKEQFEFIFASAVIHNFTKNDANLLLSLIYQWLHKNGILFLSTTIHEKSEEGFSKKEGYTGNVKRYRKKYTETEILEVLQKKHFVILEKIYTNERNRNKVWINIVCKKEDKI